MKKEFFINNWQILSLNLIVLLCFILGYGRYGDIIFDSFREFYFPAQMLKGEVLYKNIFNIYAPFAYLFNALLLKIFGVKLSVLYFAGFFTALGITNLIFLISNKFFSKNYSLGIVLCFVCTTILSPNGFNCFFPYSYGIIYGLFFVLASVYFALNSQFQLAFFMYSFSVCSKYEFLFFLPMLIIFAGKSQIWKNLIALILPVLITYIPLFIQGVGVENLIISFQMIMLMSSAKTLHWFYSVTGLVFRPELIILYLINIVKVIIPTALIYFIKGKWFLPIIFVYCYFVLNQEILIYVFPLLLILFVIRFKELSKNEKFFIVSSILISAKVFFALTIQSYGVFFLPFAMISLLLITPQKLRKSLLIILILGSIGLGCKNIKLICDKKVKVQTPVGIVYANLQYGYSINEIIKYVENNTASEDRVIVYPEGLVVNVLAERKSDNKFYSLIPLYVELFGNKIVINRFENLKPEYIIINNYDTSINYYYALFGEDYAAGIFEYIENNYEKQAQIGNDFKFTVYKRINN